MTLNISRFATAFCLTALVLAPVSAQNSSLRGTVEIDGSSTVYPISEAAASGFNKSYSNVKVNVGVSGTGEASSDSPKVKPIFQTLRGPSRPNSLLAKKRE